MQSQLIMIDPSRHYLTIDSVTVSGGGRIGMCACPGGRRLLVSDRDANIVLEHDVAVIRSWGATGIVSLIESNELVSLGIADLPRRVDDHGLWWRHLPIRDMCAPDRLFEETWSIEGARLRAILRDGGAFVLHCWAGLGRTGTVAARLLVELGAEPAEAISGVREARPGTIQTVQQELHVHRCRPVDP